MSIDEALNELSSPTNVKFIKLLHICNEFFGPPRKNGSHHVFRTPWPGEPRVNIQKEGSKAKPYQVRQVVKALLVLRDL